MLIPTRLSMRAHKGGWSHEDHPSFEAALLRWMRIDPKKRYGGLLSHGLAPVPRDPSDWEIGHIGLLCVTREMYRAQANRMRVKVADNRIDPTEVYPYVHQFVAFDEEVPERSWISDPATVARWEAAIARLAGNAGAAPRDASPASDTPDRDAVVDAEWTEVTVAPGPPPMLPPPAMPEGAPRAAAGTSPVPPSQDDAGIAPPGLHRLVEALEAALGPARGMAWTRSVLDHVPSGFADDAAAAAWGRAAAAAMRALADGMRVPPGLTALERRVWSALPGDGDGLRKVEVARALGHGRGAVNRAVDALVAKGAASGGKDGLYRQSAPPPDVDPEPRSRASGTGNGRIAPRRPEACS